MPTHDTPNLHVRLAASEEFEQIVQLYADTAYWMVVQGIEQWTYPPEEGFKALLQKALARGGLYLAWESAGAEPVGAFRIEWQPNNLWQSVANDAGYLYSLAIHPRAHGRGYGIELVRWVEACVKQHGYAYLRLDCQASNGRLRRYYEAQGFCFRGEASDGDFRGALYEKRFDLSK